jgi:hypothetical protein
MSMLCKYPSIKVGAGKPHARPSRAAPPADLSTDDSPFDANVIFAAWRFRFTSAAVQVQVSRRA